MVQLTNDESWETDYSAWQEPQYDSEGKQIGAITKEEPEWKVPVKTSSVNQQKREARKAQSVVTPNKFQALAEEDEEDVEDGTGATRGGARRARAGADADHRPEGPLHLHVVDVQGDLIHTRGRS